jgi:hypothetical protein
MFHESSLILIYVLHEKGELASSGEEPVYSSFGDREGRNAVILILPGRMTR